MIPTVKKGAFTTMFTNKDNIMQNEPVYPLLEKDGTFTPLGLLFPIKEIIKVTDSAFEKEYIAGVDYELTSDGLLKIIVGGAIPCVPYGAYYPDELVPGEAFGRTVGGLIMFSEDGRFHKSQIAVTYKYDGQWDGPLPENQSKKINRFLEKAEKKDAVTVLFYGDSITVGANASSFMGLPPYSKTWTEQVTEAIEKKYDNHNINYVNTAVGGTTSDWGLQEANERVFPYQPDVMFLAFGMNCGGAVTPERFKENLKGIISVARESNPQCDVVLISTSLPNEDVAGFMGMQPLYIEKIREIAEELDHVAVTDMTGMHQYLLTKKRFCDMTGNNVNHPNDFLVNVYADTVIKTIL